MKLLLLFLLNILHITMIRIERTTDCAWHCSKGLQCKPKAYSPLSIAHCRNQPVSSDIFHNVTLSTVLACEGRQCSLQLKTTTSLYVTGDIRGVSMCADSAGMIGHCQIYTFGQTARGNLTGKQVDIKFKCVPVRPGQDVFVSLKTVPSYCKAIWTQRHLVPECSHEGIRDEIAECNTGKLAYTLDKTRREITVTVTDAPPDTDYNLRLCHKLSLICAGIGIHKMIKAKHLQRSITFQYSKALPCLCIEGWPVRTDARRIQMCPFKNNLEELWSGITYDPFKQELRWNPLCPIKVSVSLCHADGGKSCRDLGNVISSEGHKVIFPSVDPHPMLCMKFTTDVGTWIQCPFVEGNFTVWSAKVTSRDGEHRGEISSWVDAKFSVTSCEAAPSQQCTQTERNVSQTITVSKMKHTVFNLSTSACEARVCIQVQRVDVQFSVPVVYCDLQHSNWCRDPERSYIQEAEKIVVPAAVFLAVLLAAVLVGKTTIKDREKRRKVWTKLMCIRERERDACLYSK